MPDVFWARKIGAERDILVTHSAASVVVNFPKGKRHDEEPEEVEEDKPFHTPPAGAPISTLTLLEQKVEERELFVEEIDAETGKAVYTAGRTLMGRNAAHTIFMLPKGRKGMPWCYLLMWDGTDSLVTLYWPQARVEVSGEHLSTLDPLVAMQRISIWRCFDAALHVMPKAGEPIIRSIKYVPAVS